MGTTTVWIGMGSNQGDRRAVLQSALVLMRENGIAVERVSHTYETEPVGFTSEAHFLNLVAEAKWSGSAEDLLAVLLIIERRLGRVRSGLQRYESRTIDLDILLFGTEVINTPELIIPHPKMTERGFVLVPLNELIPSYIHPLSGDRIDRLLESCIDGKASFIRHKPLSVNP
jgi:2-amino-4-hydroxy-6-hydroxymethyldihydropteridine diphosphokinase